MVAKQLVRKNRDVVGSGCVRGNDRPWADRLTLKMCFLLQLSKFIRKFVHKLSIYTLYLQSVSVVSIRF